ncbi:hypothetical protein CEXT_653641 [Caerostris extrusa]|uniref:Uncharacterized protein n=1 Tax=Caerostris extrusa TaxID=172846 RepID=A0AAV4N8S3_CAEEX|nr:hypothetical protein CEXT_653641 [Caerostris extrusa]
MNRNHFELPCIYSISNISDTAFAVVSNPMSKYSIPHFVFFPPPTSCSIGIKNFFPNQSADPQASHERLITEMLYDVFLSHRYVWKFECLGNSNKKEMHTGFSALITGYAFLTYHR